MEACRINILGSKKPLDCLYRERKCQRTFRKFLVVKAEDEGMFQKLGKVLQSKVKSDFDRVFKGTAKSREKLGVVDELVAYWTLENSEDTLEELEDVLISADFGPKTALQVVDTVREEITSGVLKKGEDIKAALRKNLVDMLSKHAGNPQLQLTDSRPNVILIVGVNGAGKTTTIGKLCHMFGKEGVKVMVAAGDTFRAAAVEQLSIWADRSGATMAPFKQGSSPEKVLGDAVKCAVEDESVDLLICDTSGRLHTNYDLMDELAACKQQIQAGLRGAPHEVLLVLDSTTGLNMLNQVREFNETVGVTGLILTKLDGTAKGGAVVSVMDQLGIPVKFVGVGEKLDDLQPFEVESFVEGLFPSNQVKQEEPAIMA
eukprot:TRINITY_DN539_c0_g1_i4.p1 TRINITY_DN539_c0_g1~~TRINITY_DN539_c0_g1_i4.p1  ORF type:complete len:373 (+),score=66.60 TRINITY_DN539_c0_g1_i4:43-1161(+)